MPAGGLGSGREVAESCLELLLLEMASHYAAPGAAQPPKAALESIGFQVGLQLVERCVPRRAAARLQPRSLPAAPGAQP
jgi:hypothetical protein